MLVTLEPFKLAVICTVPGVLALTVMGALVWPAGTVTLLGTNAIPGAVLLSATVVSVCCAALIVTVSVPDPPCVIVRVPGDRLVTVGGAGVTWTVLVALPPFSDTVMRALPTLTAVTGTGTLVCPAAKATDAGTVATPVLELLALSVPAVVGVGDRVAVSVPVAPTVMVSGLGVRAVGTGLGLPIVVPNRACRLVASKYRRSPTALLWPAHLVLSGLVPIRVETFSDRASVVPLNGAGANEPNAAVASRALAGFRVIPVIQRVSPDATSVPFLDTSANRSKLVP